MPMSTKRKVPAKLAAPVIKAGATISTKSIIDETRTSVAGTDALQGSHIETIDISSNEGSEDDISDQEDSDEVEQVNGEKDATKPTAAVAAHVNGKHAGRDVEGAEESDGEPTWPSFGELLRDNEVIDVPALLQQPTASDAAIQRPQTAIVPLSHLSLTTVLTQALRTDDTDLLESCLHTNDLTTVRNTIERIDSALAGNLLTKLAARLYRRPGRAGNLMTWVQWTLVSHGGALASQPKVIHNLNGLQKVLAERSKGLNSLMALKGKLDLLDGQMDLRRRMQRGSTLLQQGEGDDDDEEDLIWVEGETDVVSDKDLSNGIGSRRKRNTDDSDDDEDVPVTNGFVGDSEDEEEASDVEEDDDSNDAEGPLDEDDVDHDDVDESMGEDEESDVEAAAPPSKIQKVARSSFSKRK
ncbi:U3 small nucleolar RNA-associated protein 5 [Tolypocladium ophioglossoides CBS 100239]|uniref:U3 small nucleolar RNA-associated protein 5 n=1 Tax=Tolypocladium ophioglossoides (strain CBS 100239) TaxID=1163406 RepID=A0A0L0NET0_TOLOC|nr:U3 small nucleolar RNA-associated protein 5 [Tolypocladium ophioglossoides CBS 100239]